MTDIPKPPSYLAKHGRKMWSDILRDWVIDTADGLAILEVACSSFDQLCDAAALIRKHGFVIRTKSGELKTNPAVAIERSEGAALLRALGQLNLTRRQPRKIGRPRTYEHEVVPAHHPHTKVRLSA